MAGSSIEITDCQDQSAKRNDGNFNCQSLEYKKTSQGELKLLKKVILDWVDTRMMVFDRLC